jgi:hypothetical protein
MNKEPDWWEWLNSDDPAIQEFIRKSEELELQYMAAQAAEEEENDGTN